MDREDIIKFFDSMSDDELKEKWEKYNEWSSEKMQSKLLLADVINPFLSGFQIKFIENKFMDKGVAVLMLHPDDMPRKNGL